MGIPSGFFLTSCSWVPPVAFSEVSPLIFSKTRPVFSSVIYSGAKTGTHPRVNFWIQSWTILSIPGPPERLYSNPPGRPSSILPTKPFAVPPGFF